MRIMLKSPFQLTAPQRQSAAPKTAPMTLGMLQADAFTPARPVQFAGLGSSKMNPEKLQANLEKGKQTIHDRDRYGNSMLRKATLAGNPESVKILLDRGANPHLQSDALWTAVVGEKNDILKLLLEKDPGLVHLQNAQGNTPLTQMAQAGRDLREFTDHLRAKGGDAFVYGEDGWETFGIEQKGGNPQGVKNLLDAGANPNHQNYYGLSALMYAAWTKHDKVAKVLLDRGANPNLQDAQGNTALTAAAVGNHPELVSLLLDQGANIHHEDKAGDTALSVAAAWGHDRTVERLMDKGAKIDHQNHNGETALSQAAYRGHLKTVKLLLDKGANPFIPDHKGRTPLVRAEGVGRDKVAKILKKAEKTFNPAKASDSQYHAESSNAQLRK